LYVCEHARLLAFSSSTARASFSTHAHALLVCISHLMAIFYTVYNICINASVCKVYMHAYMHIYTRLCLFTGHIYQQQECICMYMHTYVSIYLHIQIHAHIHVRMWMHTYIHACMHTCIRAYMHTYIFIRTQIQTSFFGPKVLQLNIITCIQHTHTHFDSKTRHFFAC
jgi:hypothetical protein